MIEASIEEDDSQDEEKRNRQTVECPAHKATAKRVLTDTQIYANSFGFLVAVNETTALALAFASYELAINPDIQEKLQSEIDIYFAENPVSDICIVADTW